MLELPLREFLQCSDPRIDQLLPHLVVHARIHVLRVTQHGMLALLLSRADASEMDE